MAPQRTDGVLSVLRDCNGPAPARDHADPLLPVDRVGDRRRNNGQAGDRRPKASAGIRIERLEQPLGVALEEQVTCRRK